MPVPEVLRVYGRTDTLTAINQQQPPSNTPAWNPNNRHRSVTRTITFHYTHGWKTVNWELTNGNWFGATFNIDLDGTLFQCEEMIVSTNHVGGAPHFRGTYAFVNQTSIGIELARFGKIQLQANGQYHIHASTDDTKVCSVVQAPPHECNYGSTVLPLSNAAPGGTKRFSLRKMRGDVCINSDYRPYYHTKVATFNDQRNHNRGTYPLDIVYTEEQYQTLIAWAKCMCEMHRIPKSFLVNPVSGQEEPWIDVLDLIEHPSAAVARINENKERVKAFQGMIGHNNIQNDRYDPGASLDYYRIKRGVSDAWWYPVNLNDNARIMDYLDSANAEAYLALTEYRDAADLDSYFAACESAAGGYFPIGINRLWHGGVHFPSEEQPRQIYAMANGKVVAARIANGTVNTSTQEALDPRFSRCFVLIRHEVHVYQSPTTADEINYDLNSTETIYSLYMHTAPITLPLGDDGGFVEDFNEFPIWLNHHMIDHAAANNDATDPAPNRGDIFYPNQPINLGDWLGATGDYISGFSGAAPKYGPTVHIEVFTGADITQFGNSPWAEEANRFSEADEHVAANIAAINTWLSARGSAALDSLDIAASLESMREVAIKKRSEWSFDSLEQLSDQVIVGSPAQTKAITEVVTENIFELHIKPLCFHAEMVNAGANADIIGPYLDSPFVWHIHPLAFLRWMNERVDTHETLMRAQDKPIRASTSNITVSGEYVIGFVDPVPVATPARGYPEVKYSDNTYEINVDVLCDRVALNSAPQQTTQFHLHLLDAIDMINDRPHGLSVVLGYSSTLANANSTHANAHLLGNACDIQPADATTSANWLIFFNAVSTSVNYINNRKNEADLVISITQDATPTHSQVSETATAIEWHRRLTAAAAANNLGILNAVDPNFPALPADISQMRIHLEVDA